MATSQLSVGDQVKYSRQWLRNTGQYTGDICFAKGRIIELISVGGSLTLAKIDWGKLNGEIPEKVNVVNLVKVGTREAV